MTQAQAVIETIEALGDIATLNQINQNIFKIKDCIWKTKTPFASIRRIVQKVIIPKTTFSELYQG